MRSTQSFIVWIAAMLMVVCVPFALAVDIKPDTTPFDGDPRKATYKRFIFTNSAKEEVPFVLFEPKLKVGEKRPLVVYLHTGGRMGGPRNGDHLGSAALRLSDEHMQKKHPCFVLAPRAIGSLWTDGPAKVARGNVPAEPGKNLQNMFDLIAELLVRHKDQIDPERIYIAGHDVGGTGALAAAAHRPELFAGVFAASPEMYRNAAPLLKDVRIAIATDPKVEASKRHREILQELNDAGSKNAVLFESSQPPTCDEALDWLFNHEPKKKETEKTASPSTEEKVKPSPGR